MQAILAQLTPTSNIFIQGGHDIFQTIVQITTNCDAWRSIQRILAANYSFGILE